MDAELADVLDNVKFLNRIRPKHNLRGGPQKRLREGAASGFDSRNDDHMRRSKRSAISIEISVRRALERGPA